MNNIIDARDIESYVIHELKKVIETINDKGVKPEFVIINASDEQANKIYIKNKVKMAEKLGLKANVIEFTDIVQTEDIIAYIDDCNRNSIPVIVQLPIYEHLDKESIINYIQPHVDADGFTNEWIGKTYMTNASEVQPATSKGVVALLNYYEVQYKGKNALVIGRGKHTGQCIANMLMNEGSTVILANSSTQDLDNLIKQADIIISCVGKRGLFKEELVKENSVVIGVGFSYISGKQVQDFDETKLSQCKLVSNRLNCTGKMTVLALMDNIVQLYKLNLNIK